MKNLLKFALLLFIGFGTLPLMAQTPAAEDILGLWLNEEGKAKIDVYVEKGKYTGKIIWLRDPNEEDTGKPKLDDENPDEKLQTRPIMGLILMEGFDYEDGEWWNGTIYDPESGSTYKCRIKMEGKDKLDVRGYIGKAWMGLGRTTYWKRTK